MAGMAGMSPDVLACVFRHAKQTRWALQWLTRGTHRWYQYNYSVTQRQIDRAIWEYHTEHTIRHRRVIDILQAYSDPEPIDYKHGLSEMECVRWVTGFLRRCRVAGVMNILRELALPHNNNTGWMRDVTDPRDSSVEYICHELLRRGEYRSAFAIMDSCRGEIHRWFADTTPGIAWIVAMEVPRRGGTHRSQVPVALLWHPHLLRRYLHHVLSGNVIDSISRRDCPRGATVQVLMNYSGYRIDTLSGLEDPPDPILEDMDPSLLGKMLTRMPRVFDDGTWMLDPRVTRLMAGWVQQCQLGTHLLKSSEWEWMFLAFLKHAQSPFRFLRTQDQGLWFGCDADMVMRVLWNHTHTCYVQIRMQWPHIPPYVEPWMEGIDDEDLESLEDIEEEPDPDPWEELKNINELNLWEELKNDSKSVGRMTPDLCDDEPDLWDEDM